MESPFEKLLSSSMYKWSFSYGAHMTRLSDWNKRKSHVQISPCLSPLIFYLDGCIVPKGIKKKITSPVLRISNVIHFLLNWKIKSMAEKLKFVVCRGGVGRSNRLSTYPEERLNALRQILLYFKLLIFFKGFEKYFY